MVTKSIDTTDLRNNMSDAINAVKSGEMLIVKKRGKEQVAIIDLDLFEDYLAAQDPVSLKKIAKAREQYKKGEVFTMEEVFGDI